MTGPARITFSDGCVVEMKISRYPEPDGIEFAELIGVNCDLEGENPGEYVPVPWPNRHHGLLRLLAGRDETALIEVKTTLDNRTHGQLVDYDERAGTMTLELVGGESLQFNTDAIETIEEIDA